MTGIVVYRGLVLERVYFDGLQSMEGSLMEQGNTVRRKLRQLWTDSITCSFPSPAPLGLVGGRGVESEGVKLSLGKREGIRVKVLFHFFFVSLYQDIF